MSTKLAADFLDKVQRSGLVSKDRLPQLLQQLEESGVNLEDSSAIADALVGNDTLTRWQAEKLLQGKHKGFFIGSYRLLKPLGRGGMGAVFLAQHEKMRRLCAVKVLPHSQIKESSSILERFYVEAQAVAALDHPNIVRAYDVNSEEKEGKDIHYLVMEFVDGIDIQNMVQDRGPLDYVKAAEFLRQTANGLAHAHEAGLVHRDIKPANLLVDTKGVVKILDLGLALVHDDSVQASLTTAHNETVLGTADYLSPEQALNSHTVDHRTDIYSLGCTGYFMLTGHPPFPEGTVAQRLVAHQVKAPKPIASERPDAPAELVAIVDKMMAKNPDDRQPNALDVARALSGWLVEHGDDDWRRQHSELTGDSGLRRATGREPTRGVSSPMSETELELLPLEESESLLPTPASGSGIRKGSGVLREEKLDPAAASEQVRFPRSEPTTAPEPIAPAATASRAPAPEVSLEELAPLGEIADLASMDAASLSGGLEGSDLLGTLSDAAAISAVDNQDPLAAINSAVLGTAARTAGSSSRLRRAEPKPASAPVGGLRSVGLPILIGGGGGLVLVLILVFVLFRGSPEAPAGGTAAMSPPPAMAPGPPEKLPVPPVVTPTPASPDTQPAKPGEKPRDTKPDQGDVKKPPEGGPPTEPPKPPKKPPRKQSSGKPVSPPEKRVPETKSPDKPQEKQPGPTSPEKPPDQPALAVTESAKATGGSQPGGKDTPAAKTVELSPRQLQELFAGIKQFSIDYQSPDKGATSKPTLMIYREIEERAAAMGIDVVKQSQDAVLHVTVTPRVEGGLLLLDLSSRLECRTADGARAVVWSKDQPGVSKMSTASKPSSMQQQVIFDLMRKEVSGHFGQMAREFRQARNTIGVKN